jgi:uncharacterized membrane protein
VAGLIALAALDVLSGARFGTLLGVMTLLLAVLAGKWVGALLGTVAGAVTRLLAVNTLDSRLHRDLLGRLLLAVLKNELA